MVGTALALTLKICMFPDSGLEQVEVYKGEISSTAPMIQGSRDVDGLFHPRVHGPDWSRSCLATAGIADSPHGRSALLTFCSVQLKAVDGL